MLRWNQLLSTIENVTGATVWICREKAAGKRGEKKEVKRAANPGVDGNGKRGELSGCLPVLREAALYHSHMDVVDNSVEVQGSPRYAM